jgi:uncharacterized membrane protein
MENNSNDKLLSALTYPLPIIGIIILISDSMKNNPLLRTHGVQSIALGVVLFVGTLVLQILPLIGQCIVPLIALAITLYYAYQAYQGKDVNIPIVTDFCKNQKWI